MDLPSLQSPDPDNNNTTSSTIWEFLSAPMAGNLSFLAGVLHWLAIVFKWFLNLLLFLLAIGIVLGIGALIFGTLDFRRTRRGDASKVSEDGDAELDAELVELDVLAVDYGAEDSWELESDGEVD